MHQKNFKTSPIIIYIKYVLNFLPSHTNSNGYCLRKPIFKCVIKRCVQLRLIIRSFSIKTIYRHLNSPHTTVISNLEYVVIVKIRCRNIHNTYIMTL